MTKLQGLIKEFLADTQARNLSLKTTRFYTQGLGKFLQFATGQKKTEFDALEVSFLRLYMGECLASLNPGGAHARMRAIRAMCSFAVQEELIPVSPFHRLKMPRVPEVDLDVISSDDFRALLAAAAMAEKPMRDQAILSILFDSGLRASELCAVRLEDVLRAEGGIVVKKGKGGKQRFVPVSKITMKKIQRYQGQERPRTGLEKLFVTDAETGLGYDSLRAMLERHCATAGIAEVRPHAFRRGFAVAYIRNGGDVFTLKRILGHATLAMSEKYARMNAQDVKDAHLRASPVSRGD